MVECDIHHLHTHGALLPPGGYLVGLQLHAIINVL